MENKQPERHVHDAQLPTFMDLKVDFAFKFIFSHENILIKLLNDVLQKDIVSIEYLPNEIPVVSEKEKRATFDVICKTPAGDRFLVEMQNIGDDDMDDRLIYYGASLIHRQIERGDTSYLLHPVYVLCIANYQRRHPENVPDDKLLFHYQLNESETNERFGHQLEIFFLELPRLQKTWPNAVTNMERWCYLFQKLSIFAKVPADASDFEDIFQTARTDQLSEEQIVKYNESMLTEYEKRTISRYYEKEGHRIGMEKGLAEGRAKGRAEGRAEGQKQVFDILQAMGVDKETLEKAKKALKGE